MAAPIGRYPLVNAFATVIISGLIPQFSTANIFPVLPKFPKKYIEMIIVVIKIIMRS